MKILQILTRIILSSNLLLAVFALQAASIDLTFKADAQLNLDNGQASPTEIIIYQLSTPTPFTKKSYFALHDTPDTSLGNSYIDSTSLQLLPNQQLKKSLTLQHGVKYIGIIAGYNDLNGITWRQVVPIGDFNQFAVTMNLTAKGMSVTKKKTTRFSLTSGMYVEISVGVPSTALSKTSYTTLTTMGGYPFVANYSFNISNANLSPLYGMGFGYQWVIQNPPDTGFFSFRTASVGVAAYAMNSLQLSGQSLYVNGDHGSSSTDLITANLAAVFIETKLGLFDLGRLVPYTSLGIGVAHFDSINFTQTINNVSDTSTPTAVNNIAFRAELGFDFYATSALSFGVGYQYLNAGKLTLDTPPQQDGSTKSYNTAPQIPIALSALTAKVRYRFKF